MPCNERCLHESISPPLPSFTSFPDFTPGGCTAVDLPRAELRCRFAEASCASSHVGILCDGSALRCQSQSNPFTVLFVLFKSSHCTRTSFSILALFNQIYEYLRYLSKTLKLGMLFLEGIRTDRTVRRKNLPEKLTFFRASPFWGAFAERVLGKHAMFIPAFATHIPWIGIHDFEALFFFVAARLDVSLDVFITSTTSWPVHLHAWNFPIFFFQKMWSCKLATPLQHATLSSSFARCCMKESSTRISCNEATRGWLMTWPWPPKYRRYPERINMDCLQYSLGLSARQSLGILVSDGGLLADLVDNQLLSVSSWASSPKTTKGM